MNYKLTARDNAIADLAEDLNCSFGEAQRVLEAREAKEREQARRPRAPRQSQSKAPKAPSLSYARVIRMAKAAGRDCMADNPEMQIEDAAYDIADCLLYDEQIRTAMERNYRKFHNDSPSRQILKEILADYVAEGGQK